MDQATNAIHGVITNVITGFLGAGKTTAISHLIAQKPAGERWAVLVNEFGEIGIDGSLYRGQSREDTGVYVAEVPGGCMCCTSSLTMQVALNRLLKQARPHRLLIEPTGLGHPLEVLEALSSDAYRDVLALGRTVALVDARHFSDSRYTAHAIFNDQLRVADVIVANKADLYSDKDQQALSDYVGHHCREGVQVLTTTQGALALSLLDGSVLEAAVVDTSNTADEHHHGLPELIGDLPYPPSGILSAMNSGEGYASIGWRFSPDHVFDRSRLLGFLTTLRVERMKAVFITQQGIFGFNLTPDALMEVELDECMESRIEIICELPDKQWEAELTACLIQAS